jgi:hypothetical protein
VPDLAWFPGDLLGLPMPADSNTLQAGGTQFLTAAFRASGVLAADNCVTQITQFEPIAGGSTGRKLLLSVEYRKALPGLQRDLFVKFSRDLDDAIRDRWKIQMEREVRFALLSRMPEFPIAVPRCFFADYHQESGTGVLITERIAFGSGEIERHYQKSLDYKMPEPLEHYKALIKALARLAGTHKAGRLPEAVVRQFPFDISKLTVSRHVPYTDEQLQKKVRNYSDFAARFPQLLAKNLTTPEFIARLGRAIPRLVQCEPAVKQILQSRPDLIALCHWNAHVDNAWFWRGAHGELECGLLDWGHVSQMNLGMAISGCLTGTEPELLSAHLDELLALFATEFERCGAASIDVADLKLHALIYYAVSGLLLLDAPVMIQRFVPDLEQAGSRLDPRIEGNEHARAQLHMLSLYLTLWQNQTFDTALSEFLRRYGDGARLSAEVTSSGS